MRRRRRLRCERWPTLARVAVIGAWLGAASLTSGCRRETESWTPPGASARQSPTRGDAARGAKLVVEFECSRCHQGTGAPTATLDKDCSGCHEGIAQGTITAEPTELARWQGRIRHFLAVPSLSSAGQKFQRSWLERYLLDPHDLRPALAESMPRLRLTPEQAADLSAYFAPNDAGSTPIEAPPAAMLARGRTLLDEKGCGTCHRMTGVAPLLASPLPSPLSEAARLRALRLAPDLRFARERLLPGYLERWLTDPVAVAADASMPNPKLSPEEIRDISAYLLAAPLARVTPPVFTRLPVLTRPVKFAEVKERVFRDTCWHCHSEPDYAIGDGGPGNTGGFGFPGKRINLAQHEGLLAGYEDATGERKSLFLAEKPSGESRLVSALLARHAEEAGTPVPGVRGMPLALPALPAEEIQLVETWIAQGRPL